MTSYLKIPGVKLQEVSFLPKQDLPTGVPVFLGIAPVGNEPQPAGQPQIKRLTLWNHFERHLRPSTPSYFARAVRGFFENGGQVCYVITLSSLDELNQGLDISETLEDVDLVCVPELAGQEAISDATRIFEQQVAVLAHCKMMGDRFAILDALNGSPDIVQGQVEYLSRADGDLDRGSYGALYYPWLTVEAATGSPRAIPPCGHMAGTYARCDRTLGVYHAPANLPIEGVVDLTQHLSDSDQFELTPESQPGVNCIRAFRGRGIRVWGARTLSQDREWQQVNVRRLFITVGRWINLHLAGVAFEPNNASLWMRLERELGVYCEFLWRQGALRGATAKEAFYVKCDAETNPPVNRERGQVCVKLGLAPTRPSEFIQVALVHGESGVTLSAV